MRVLTIILVLFLMIIGSKTSNSQQVNYSCPTGDTYRCVYISEVSDIWKGQGESTHTIKTK